MTLYFIGLGLGSPGYLTLKALEISEKLDKLYLDTYTSFIDESLREVLRRRFGGKLIEVNREMLEDRAAELVEEAKEKAVGILVPGDPFIATTHLMIAIEAVKRGVSYEIVYGVSAYCALISASCLQAYKFGKVTTIPKSGLGVETCYKVIEENMERGLHTLVLLDTADGGLTIPEGLAHLSRAERRIGRGIINEDRLVICLARVGFNDEYKWAGRLKEALEKEYPPPPHSIIFPGSLHFAEAEALKTILKVDQSSLQPHGFVKSWDARLTKYLSNVDHALKTLKLLRRSPMSQEVVDLARSYLEDSTLFYKEGKCFEALAAISYAEGLLDCLRILREADFAWKFEKPTGKA